MLNVTQSHVKYNERQDASEKLLDHQSYLFFVSFAFNFSLERYSSVLYSRQNHAEDCASSVALVTKPHLIACILNLPEFMAVFLLSSFNTF